MDAPFSTPAEAAALHARLLVLDSHVDIPWPPDSGGAFQERTRRCVDLPKLREGGVDATCFAAFVPQGATDAAGHRAAWQRAEAMLRAIANMGAGTEAVLCDSADAIERAWSAGQRAIVPCLENGYAVGDDLSLLAQLRALGCVYVTLTHNGHNLLGDSAIPRADLRDPPARHGGLSPLGVQAIAAMNRAGLMIDVAHAARATMIQAAEHSHTPVVSTHSCVRALCDHPRNLDDGQLDVLRDVDGVIQITALSAFVRPGGKPEQVTVADMLDHVDYAVRRIGLRHVGIGSDFDGGGGIAGYANAAESAAVTAGLLARGYDAQAIGLLWGGNFLRVMRAVQRAAG
jgi:membrane dipeptidase